MSSGALRHPRFTRQEVESSNGREHDKLWNTFLFLEPAGANAGTRGSISRGEGRADSQNGNPLGAVERLATRYGRDPREVIGEASHRFGRNKLRPSRMESRHPGGANATLGRDGVPPPSAARRDASPHQFFFSRRQDGGSSCCAAKMAALHIAPPGLAAGEIMVRNA